MYWDKWKTKQKPYKSSAHFKSFLYSILARYLVYVLHYPPFHSSIKQTNGHFENGDEKKRRNSWFHVFVCDVARYKSFTEIICVFDLFLSSSSLYRRQYLWLLLFLLFTLLTLFDNHIQSHYYIDSRQQTFKSLSKRWCGAIAICLQSFIQQMIHLISSRIWWSLSVYMKLEIVWNIWTFVNTSCNDNVIQIFFFFK